MPRQLFMALMMTAILLLSSALSRAFAEKRYLIAVGVDRYQSLDVEFDLHGASADVANVVKVMGEKFAFGSRPEWVLFNNAATFTRINAARTEVERQAQSGDEVVFYFSGRGSTTQSGQPTIAPFDADDKDASRDVSVRALCDWMNSLESKGVRVTVILDCGFAPSPAKGRPMRPKFYLRPHTAPTPMDAMETLEVKGVLVTACKANELARECLVRRGYWEGIFTRFLVKALREYQLGERSASWRQLIGDSSGGTVTPSVIRYVSINYDDDVELQTPSVYGKKDRVLFSGREVAPTPPASQPPPPSQPLSLVSADERTISLRLLLYNDGSASAELFQRFEQQLRDRLSRLEYVRLTESDEAAHRTLSVYYAEGRVSAFLTNSNREILGKPVVGALDDTTKIVEAVNENLGGTYWYRWLASLQTDSSFAVQLSMRNKDGQPQSAFALGEEAHFVVKADKECTVTLLEMNVADTRAVRALLSQKVTPQKEWDIKTFAAKPAGRFIMVAVATLDDTPYQKVLEHLYLAQDDARASGEKGITPPVPKGLFSGDVIPRGFTLEAPPARKGWAIAFASAVIVER